MQNAPFRAHGQGTTSPDQIDPTQSTTRKGKHMIELGRRAKDKITGFAGTVTGYVVYITGCNQALIVADAKDGKAGEASWYDEQRVEYTDDSKIILDNTKTPGFDAPAPVR
jgi:hypothetical protein